MPFGLPDRPAGNPGELDSMAAAWTTLAQDIGELHQTMNAAIQELDGSWKGPGSEGFTDFWSKYQTAFPKGIDSWNEMSQNITKAAEQISRAQSDYDHAVEVMAATAAAGLALSVFTFGGSDAAAAATDAAEAGIVATVLSTLSSGLAAIGEVFGLSAATSVSLGTMFALNFTLSIAGQVATSELDGNGLGLSLDSLKQALVMGGVGAVTMGAGSWATGALGDAANNGIRFGINSATGLAWDAGDQLILHPGKFNLDELFLSGAGGGLGGLLGEGGLALKGMFASNAPEEELEDLFPDTVFAKLEGLDPGSHANGAYKAELQDGTLGVFKPSSEEMAGLRPNIPDGTGPVREIAASEVDKLLGFKIVPETVGYKDASLGEGSFQSFADGAKQPLASYPAGDQEKMGVFDYIMGNTDRHLGNHLSFGDGSVAAIDNGSSLPVNESFPIRSPWTQGIVGQDISPATLTQVRAVSPEQLTQTLTKLGIEPDAIKGAVTRLEEVQSGQISLSAWKGGFFKQWGVNGQPVIVDYNSATGTWVERPAAPNTP